MDVIYLRIMIMYLPALILALIMLFKDKLEPNNELLKNSKWSLLPAVVILFFIASNELVASLWYSGLVPFLKDYAYTSSKWQLITVIFDVFYLLLSYVILRYFYKVKIQSAFGLEFSQFPFILKVCGGLAVINLVSNYLLNSEIFLNLRNMLESIRPLDNVHVVIFFVDVIMIGPIAEEAIFRGLIYGPLYRKVGRRFAMTLTALLWTSVHYYALIPHVQLYVIGLFVHGLVYAWLYDRSGSLIHPVIFHMFINSWTMLPYFLNR